jgi:hypothetical protein
LRQGLEHRQLADLTFQLRDLAFVFGNTHGSDDFIGQLPGFVLAHPLAEQIARQIMLARQFAQTHPSLQKVQNYLPFEFQAEPPMPCHSQLSSKPARPVQSPYLSNFRGSLQNGPDRIVKSTRGVGGGKKPESMGYGSFPSRKIWNFPEKNSPHLHDRRCGSAPKKSLNGRKSS